MKTRNLILRITLLLQIYLLTSMIASCAQQMPAVPPATPTMRAVTLFTPTVTVISTATATMTVTSTVTATVTPTATAIAYCDPEHVTAADKAIKALFPAGMSVRDLLGQASQIKNELADIKAPSCMTKEMALFESGMDTLVRGKDDLANLDLAQANIDLKDATDYLNEATAEMNRILACIPDCQK